VGKNQYQFGSNSQIKSTVSTVITKKMDL